MPSTRHTYKHTTLGFVADIKAMPGYYDYSRQFFQRFYRPENVTLLVVGDVQPQRVFDLAKTVLRRLEAGVSGRPTVLAEPPQTETQEGGTSTGPIR